MDVLDPRPKVLAIIEREPRLARMVEKEPRLLQLLHVAASQSRSRISRNRWEVYEAFKKSYREIVQSSSLQKDASLHEYHQIFISAVDELLPMLNTHEVLQLEFAEPNYDDYGEEY